MDLDTYLAFSPFFPVIVICFLSGFLLTIPLGIWGITMLADSTTPPPKPSPRERWFDIAKWYLIIIGILGTLLSIIGGVIVVMILIVPCYVFYLMLPGPKPDPNEPQISSYTYSQSSLSSSENSNRITNEDADWTDNKDDDKDDGKDDGYVPSFMDGVLMKYGTYKDDDD